ncbi:MAG TPA: SCO family protein [Steroidobacteraceae bacterium]|nr:SCO family protein [Steroidobacteraceae bacterium]
MVRREAFSYHPWIAAGLASVLCAVAMAHGAGLAGGVRLAVLPQSWRDDSGRPISLAGLSGQRVVLTMAYANCHRICPATIEGLKRLQAALDAKGEQAEFVIVGYDPENEDPATWHRYRSSHRLGRSNWHFVTGSVGDTAQLARQLHFELWKYDEHVMHDSRVLLFDSNGLLSREFGPDTKDWSSVL